MFNSMTGIRAMCAATAVVALSVGVVPAMIGGAAAQQRSATALVDHPLVGRLEGAQILLNQASNFDAVNLVTAPTTLNATQGGAGPGYETKEGKTNLIYYRMAAGTSPLQVVRSYEASLKARGFEIDFSCNASDKSCFSDGWDAPISVAEFMGSPIKVPNLDGDYIHNQFQDAARYMLARLDRPEGAVYVAIAAGERSGQTRTIIRVVETKEFKASKIEFVGVKEIKEVLTKTGSVDLYGILFDHDKDTLRPESRRTIAEISKLLVQSPGLKLEIVGHTDNSGTAAYNVDLSNRRALRVVETLVREFGVAQERLTARGEGQAQPVAGNDTDAGRAKNRRVELVSK